ncbi:SsrA-binding protein [candidate division WWE3 bacterium RBG_16_37_10]|uniref:SsrA-binding protein n=1 Tax=candidate division WWE3 bacterium RBG_16_37_10 TaxID=1802610 RepID=A0A1F4UYX2_UNCKA|nr:MAG: SsrA-binding protein [candidate division WWE3 bacterium RBG_16_37_10]
MLLVKNRSASFDYELLGKFTAGIVLKGYEVKAVKEKRANLTGAYVQLLGDKELYVINMYIGKYSKQSQKSEETDLRRTRKLLLTGSEIEKVRRMMQQKGRTAVPTALLLEHNLVKLEFAIAKGRKQAQKRHLEKEKQIKKDLETEAKEFNRSEGFTDT